jgi:hypothetical protein
VPVNHSAAWPQPSFAFQTQLARHSVLQAWHQVGLPSVRSGSG